MSAFTVAPKNTRMLAVRSWPGDEETIENLFGDRVSKVMGQSYDWEVRSHGRYTDQLVQRGDWFVLTGHNHIVRYTHEKFEADFIILESAFDLDNPTGMQEPE